MRLGSAQFFRLCREEPFRILFPLGLTSGCVGVSLRPRFFLHALAVYPAVTHARLMIEGMMTCFIFGLLGMAGPRVMSVSHFSGSELAWLVVGVSAAVILHLMRYHSLGDLLFFFALKRLVAGRSYRKDSSLVSRAKRKPRSCVASGTFLARTRN